MSAKKAAVFLTLLALAPASRVRAQTPADSVAASVRLYADANGLPRPARADDVIVDPLTGQSYARSLPPRPAPVQTWTDANGVTHYPIETDASRRTALLDALCARIAADGARPEARLALEKVIRAMFAQTPLDLLQRMADADLSIAIVPEGLTIPEMPGAAALAGKTAPDGRTIEQVRGLATSETETYERRSVLLIPDGDAPAREVVFSRPVEVPAGAWKIYVPEANLMEPPDGPKGRDGLPRETAVHELAHAVHKVGTADEFGERWGLDRDIVIEREYREASGYTDAYAKTNSGEFFAQATVSWFGLNSTGKDADWIKDHDPELYQTLLAIYGPPRSLDLK